MASGLTVGWATDYLRTDLQRAVVIFALSPGNLPAQIAPWQQSCQRFYGKTEPEGHRRSDRRSFRPPHLDNFSDALYIENQGRRRHRL